MRTLILLAALAPLAAAPALAGDGNKSAMTPMPQGTERAAGNPCFHADKGEVAALPATPQAEEKQRLAQAEAAEDDKNAERGELR